MLRLPRLIKGTPKTAESVNAIFAAIERVMQLNLGPGLEGSWDQTGVAIRLAGVLPEYFVLARIVSRTGAAPDKAANIKYRVQGIKESGAELVDAVPAVGRPCGVDQAAITNINPAPIGGLCWIVRRDDGAELWLPAGYETLRYKLCAVT